MVGSAASDMREIESHRAPAIAYLYPETINPTTNASSFESVSRNKIGATDTFVFQYFPEEVSDSHPPNYAQQEIPGGSHPLYQYVGGMERLITFTATFTSEIAEPEKIDDLINTPSAKYTVDVKAALAGLLKFKYADYKKGGQSGRTIAPPRLILVLDNMNLGRDRDEILVILKSAPVTYQSWFPDGTPRIATVDLEFAECVQQLSSAKEGPSQINFIGSDRYQAAASRYKYLGGSHNAHTTG